MKKRAKVVTAAAVMIAVGTILFFFYERRSDSEHNPTLDVLWQMPSDASTVLYIDINALRQSPFLAELYKWAPQRTMDADYAQFVQSTGFNYESDLDRIGIAMKKRSPDTTLFAVADGHFNRKKISAYASQTGTRENRNGHEIFSVPGSAGSRRIAFTFLADDRIALTNDADAGSQFPLPQPDSDAQAWRERFRRLAGSPIFAVVRQDSNDGGAWRAQPPGGIQSPQLSALLDQLQWITVAGKPEGDHLRVVLEGEGSAETNTRQLSDLISTLLVLAQASLSDSKMRQQLQPQVREAYLEVLKSADVSQIDRGETKSVRLIFDLTPNFLEAARSAMPIGPPAPPSKRTPNKSTIRN